MILKIVTTSVVKRIIVVILHIAFFFDKTIDQVQRCIRTIVSCCYDSWLHVQCIQGPENFLLMKKFVEKSSIVVGRFVLQR